METFEDRFLEDTCVYVPLFDKELDQHYHGVGLVLAAIGKDTLVAGLLYIDGVIVYDNDDLQAVADNAVNEYKIFIKEHTPEHQIWLCKASSGSLCVPERLDNNPMGLAKLARQVSERTLNENR